MTIRSLWQAANPAELVERLTIESGENRYEVDFGAPLERDHLD